MDEFFPSYDLVGLSAKSTGGKISKVRFDNTKQEFESNEILFATGSWDTPKVLILIIVMHYFINVFIYILSRGL